MHVAMEITTKDDPALRNRQISNRHQQYPWMSKLRTIPARKLLGKLLELDFADIDVLKTLHCATDGPRVRAFLTDDEQTALILSETSIPKSATPIPLVHLVSLSNTNGLAVPIPPIHADCCMVTTRTGVELSTLFPHRRVKLFSRSVLFSLTAAPNPVPLRREVQVVTYHATDEDRFIRDIQADNPRRFFHNLCAASDRAAAFVVSTESRLASVAYAAPSVCNPLDAFEVVGVFTVPDLRRSGLGSRAVAAAARYSLSLAPNVFYFTTPENAASVGTALTVGFDRCFESDTWIVDL